MSGEMVVLVRDGGTAGVARLIEVVHAAGCVVGVVSGPVTGEARRAQDRSVAAVVEVADVTDVAQLTDAVTTVSAGYRLSAVMASSDSHLAAAAEAAERAGLSRTPAAPIVASRNKFTARELLEQAGAPTPRYALLAGEEQVAQVAAQVGFPAVVKPISGTASHLVVTVADEGELAAAYRTLAQRLPMGPLGHLYRQPLDAGPHGMLDPSSTVLVEHLLQGREYCIDLIVRDGVLETLPLVDKALLDDKFFELAFVNPAFDLPPEREQAIRECAESAVRIVGLDNTFAHIEVIDDATLGPTIVEVNGGRPGGLAPMLLYHLTTGVDTLAEHLSVLRGAPSPRQPPKLPIPMATLAVYAREEGVLRAVHGLDEVQAHPDVITASAALQPGAVLSGDREVIVATAMVAGFLDRADLADTYEQLVKAVRVECDPPAENPPITA